MIKITEDITHYITQMDKLEWRKTKLFVIIKYLSNSNQNFIMLLYHMSNYSMLVNIEF